MFRDVISTCLLQTVLMFYIVTEKFIWYILFRRISVKLDRIIPRNFSFQKNEEDKYSQFASSLILR